MEQRFQSKYLPFIYSGVHIMGTTEQTNFWDWEPGVALGVYTRLLRSLQLIQVQMPKKWLRQLWPRKSLQKYLHPIRSQRWEPDAMGRTLWSSDTWFLDLTVSEHVNGGTATTSFFKFFFWHGSFLKFHLLQYCFCFIFWLFGHKAYGILVPQPRVQATLPALEGDSLVAGSLGQPHYCRCLCLLGAPVRWWWASHHNHIISYFI